MSENKTEVSLIGGSTTGLLAVAFIVLKLCGVIGWSWLWVTAPLWAPLAVLLTLGLVAFMLVGFVWLVTYLVQEGAAKKRKLATKEAVNKILARNN